MSFCDDRRGRVPFALIGVLVLLGASVYATGVADRSAPSVERPAGAAMDDVSRDTRPALRAAVRTAARESALEPVTAPADTPAGRAVNESAPFADALRLRIAAEAREALSGITRRRNGVTATAGLPAIDGATESFRRAKRGVDVRPTDGGASMVVTLRNVTIRAHNDGRVVAERRQNVSLTVATPTLALHRRTERYERRLNRGAIAGPGLARGLTGRLTAITMARAYGRYGGAPIQNVLGNRHVALSTNAALLAQQRAAFGRADPDGERAVGVATVRVGVLDVLGGRHGAAADWTKTLLDPGAVGTDTDPAAESGFDPRPPDAPPITAEPVAAADEAFLASEQPDTAGSYRVRARLRTEVLNRSSEPRTPARLENWTLLTERTSERTRVTVVAHPSTRTGATVETVRKVTTRHTIERRWYRNGTFRTTTDEWDETVHVAVHVGAMYAPDDTALDRRTEPLFERGGALDGPNLVGARRRAAEALVEANGGIDAIAETVARAGGNGRSLEHSRTVTGARPDGLDAWITADLRGLRQRVANVSVSVPRRAVAVGEANAPALLAERLRVRRTALLDAPESYDGVADRARVAARAAFLDRVLASLEDRAANTRGRNVDYREELPGRVTGSLSELIALGREGADDVPPVGTHQRGQSGDDGLSMTPDGSPAYLTLEPVDHERVPSVPAGESAHPLTARTTNWVAMPYGDVADGLVDTLFGGGDRQVSLGTAAATLIAANRTAPAGTQTNGSAVLAGTREELVVAVRRSTLDAERAACDAALEGTAIERDRCRAAVVDTRSRWSTLGHRAQAMANGSYAAAFADSLAAGGVDAATADEAAVRVRVRLRELDAERETSVPAATTNRTASATQRLAERLVRQQASALTENASRRAMRRLTGASRLPAGVPVAPPPYPWIATANAWSVTVRGEYGRFAVRAAGTGPDGSGGVVRYVRDGSTVRFDADGDGEAEVLGRNERVSFDASTTVVAVVPSGPPGVGDVDGNRDEQSPGWPCPGVEHGDACEDGNQPE
ncbi:hypothetical protein JCM30237_20470 [Halolamina litorea]|uniref:Uncharacterized protein n=1 Tax=Halolamina litorea TaxID=1515593 RepID=A0ABD6BPR5_9EURY|nr:hypothetical protein [Halolamina litorea]